MMDIAMIGVLGIGFACIMLFINGCDKQDRK